MDMFPSHPGNAIANVAYQQPALYQHTLSSHFDCPLKVIVPKAVLLLEALEARMQGVCLAFK